MNQPLTNISVSPDETNVQLWQITMTGPVSCRIFARLQVNSQANTPYAGGKFILTAEFSLEFPFKPPMVRLSGDRKHGEVADNQMKFKTKAYHPNIDSDGK